MLMVTDIDYQTTVECAWLNMSPEHKSKSRVKTTRICLTTCLFTRSMCVGWSIYTDSLPTLAYQHNSYDPARNRRLDSLVVECWLRVRELPGSIPSQGPRHTKDIIKMVPAVPLFSTQHWKKGNTGSFSRIKIRQ